ncbi:MAG: hypothetical protein GC161_13455 [Planctomycetaceae bacterium]|nr:hypothetical protein [Planctomycetaceae bacterium]
MHPVPPIQGAARALLAALAACSAGCGPGHTVAAAGPAAAGALAAPESAPIPAARPVPRTEDLGRDLRVEVLAEGTGPALAPGARARIHYRALAAGAEQPFDSTRGRGVPFAVDLSRTPIVPGLRLALEGRRAGDELRVHVPAALGWADLPSAPVPPGTDLVFEVHIVSVP